MMHPGFPLRFLYGRWGSASVYLFLLLFLGSIFAKGMEHSAAMNQTSFLVPASDTNSVVVYKNDDRLVCVYVDPQTKKVGREFILLPTSAEKGVKLETKKLGSLVFDK